MFSSHAGAAGQAAALPANVFLSDTASANGGSLGTVQLGAYDPTRATIISVGMNNNAGGTITATLDSDSFTSVVNINSTPTSNDPSGILILDTGAGSNFVGATSATLTITGPGTISQSMAGIYNATNLATLTADSTDSNINQNAVMTVNKIAGGIAIQGGYVNNATVRSWVNIATTSQVIQAGHSAFPGHENTATTINENATIDPLTGAGDTRSWVGAVWRGASNP